MDAPLVVASIYLVFAFVEIAAGKFFHKNTTTRGDVWIEIIMTLFFPIFIVPLIFAAAPVILETIAPEAIGAIAHWPWYALLLCFLIGDDMTQYWWHRLSHALPWLYSLHRAHHDVAYMSVRLVYRNSLIYYLFMPGIWASAFLVAMGGLEVYAVYLVVKMTVIIGAHSSVAWDERLYKSSVARPIMWVLERIISTPSTHRMHHGRHLSDGVTHYKGNYGNLLFLWDILFGTARITRAYPDAYGIEHLKPVPWYQLVFTPFRRPEYDGSEKPINKSA